MNASDFSQSIFEVIESDNNYIENFILVNYDLRLGLIIPKLSMLLRQNRELEGVAVFRHNRILGYISHHKIQAYAQEMSVLNIHDNKESGDPQPLVKRCTQGHLAIVKFDEPDAVCPEDGTPLT